MDRLFTLTAAASLLLLCPAVQGQYYDGDSYVIAGDVLNPGVYDFQAGSAVTVEALLAQGGPVHPDGKIFVLRGEPKQVETLETLAQVRQNLLTAGDVVVFKSDVPVRLEQNHVVVLQGGAATILSFPAFSSFSFRALATKSPELASLGSGFVDVNRPSTESAGSIAVEEAVKHGDVIELPAPQNMPAISFATPAQAGALAMPTVPEILPAGESPNAELSLPQTAANVRPVSSSDFSLSIPDQTQAAAAETVEPDDSSLTPSILDGDPFVDIEQNNERRDGQIAAAEILENTATYSAEPLPAPLDIAAEESQAADAPTESSGIWNGLFLLGMMFAVGLILVGWVKTQQDREDERQRNSSMRNSISGATHEPVASQAEPQPLPGLEPAMQNTLLAESDADTIHAITSDDSIEEDCPVLSAGQTHLQSGTNDGSDFRPDSFDRDDDHQDGPGGDGPSTYGEPLIDRSETYSNEVAETAITEATDTFAEPLVDDTEIDWERTHEKTVANSSGLDELLENRLPIELQKAELPLKVALYGKPAGPRKIRIDAAHTQIAAPHMARRPSEARKAQPVAVAAKTQQKASSQQASESRFDNALNKLSRQEES